MITCNNSNNGTISTNYAVAPVPAGYATTGLYYNNNNDYNYYPLNSADQEMTMFTSPNPSAPTIITANNPPPVVMTANTGNNAYYTTGIPVNSRPTQMNMNNGGNVRYATVPVVPSGAPVSYI